MKTHLERIESRIRSLIEARAEGRFASSNLIHYLIHHLVSAMAANLRPEADGRLLAPNHYTITLHPSAAHELQGSSTLLESLTALLQSAAIENGCALPGDLTLILAADHGLEAGAVRVQPRFHFQSLEQTKSLSPETLDEAQVIPPNAFLIVDGVRVFPLVRSVINIGRRPDNHLVIDDPRVSRTHAQVRAVRGHFMIFDLGSTGGTFVNDQRVNQWTLQPGDVISLAGVPLVFGQEPPARDDDSDQYTRPMDPDGSAGDERADPPPLQEDWP